MSAEIFWLYEVVVKPGQLDTLRTLMAGLVESTRAEPRALSYEWSINDEGCVAHIDERYADSGATLAHVAVFRETFANRFLAAVEPARVVVCGTPSEAVKEALKPFPPRLHKRPRRLRTLTLSARSWGRSRTCWVLSTPQSRAAQMRKGHALHSRSSQRLKEQQRCGHRQRHCLPVRPPRFGEALIQRRWDQTISAEVNAVSPLTQVQRALRN